MRFWVFYDVKMECDIAGVENGRGKYISKRK